MKKTIFLALLFFLFVTTANTFPRFGGGQRGSGTITITGITVGGSSSIGAFSTASAAALVGAISVQATGGIFGGTVTLGTGCTNTDNGKFQVISNTTLNTNGAQQPIRLNSSTTYKVCLVATQVGAVNSPLAVPFQITGVETPGVSAALYANPYYTCSANYYVATTGSDAANGTSLGTAWQTIAHADAVSRSAGDCINVQPGTYSEGNRYLTQGGTSASATGYVTYRCATLNGCTITNNTGAFLAATNNTSTPSYLIFDGFNLASSSYTGGFSIGIGCAFPASGTNAGCHHWWVINNAINGYGQTGLQLNGGDYMYSIHNKITNSSQGCSVAQGSAISYVGQRFVVSYTPTADDTNNPKMGIVGPGFPFTYAILFNNMSNNFVGCTGGNTDGNAVIIDSSYGNGAAVQFTNQGLIAQNVGYNNGAKCIWIFYSVNVTSANNSCYNDNLDTYNSGTARGEIGSQNAFGDFFVNNLVYAIQGSSPLNSNTGFGLSGTVGHAAETSATNITYCSTGGNCNYAVTNATFDCVSANKCNVIPNWVNVGNSSPGTESTQPVGVNFALSNSSAAIGYATSETYLYPESVDVGACSHLLASCP